MHMRIKKSEGKVSEEWKIRNKKKMVKGLKDKGEKFRSASELSCEK